MEASTGENLSKLRIRYRELLCSIPKTPRHIDRGWKHLEMAEISAKADDLEQCLWHLSLAARIAYGVRHEDLLKEVRAFRESLWSWRVRCFVEGRFVDDTLDRAFEGWQPPIP